jgi:DNA-binding helix-hairpin-helix protein with protein kinase domain
MLRSSPIGGAGLLAPGARLAGDISGTTIEIESRIAAGGQGEIYQVAMAGHRLALKWYRPEVPRQDPLLRDRLRRLARRDPPSPRFLWPIDLAVAPDRPGEFGYLMPLREARFRDFGEVIAGRVRPSLRTLATACLEMVQEYRALHAGGWCYMDINFGNVALDPATGEVRICDNDNADVNEATIAAAFGTPGFMAPEIVRREARPTIVTDLWSLAVLLFWALVRSDPLLGRREAECLVMDGPTEQRLYGLSPVFIFDPADDSNRPVPGCHDNALLIWPILPGFLRALFERAFTAGIRDPRHGRVQESEWRTALARLRDAIQHCPACGAESFHDPAADAPARCWNRRCGQPLPAPLLLEFADGVLVAADGASVFPHHLEKRRRFDFGEPVAQILRHPSRPDRIGLRNAGSAPIAARLAEGRERRLAPGQVMELVRGLEIAFPTGRAKVA